MGFQPKSVATADFNGDGKADLAAATWNGNNVTVLLNTTPLATSVFSNLSSSSSVSYGTASVAFSGTIAAGSLIPPSSETVAITLDGVTQNAPIGSEGRFTATFNTSTLPVAAKPYQVTYAYAGDTRFYGVNDSTTTTLTVAPAVPAWLAANSIASWNGGTQTLTVTGNAMIIADPATFGDTPIIDCGPDSQMVLDTATATIGGLALQSGATLDIANNTLLIKYGNGSSPLAVVQAAVADGSIISTVAVTTAGQFAVGYANCTEASVVPGGDVELTYALAADALLRGAANFLDYSVLQNNYDQSGRDWAQGDWNNDGVVNFNDYDILQNDYNQSVQLTPTPSWATPAAITYGIALSSTQLDATDSASGDFRYSPASGTVLAAGTHFLTATFYPTVGTYPYNAYATVILTVNKAPTITTLASSNGSTAYGQPVTFTATVTPSSASGETGTVQFQIDGGNVGTPVTLSGNTATYTTSALALGSHSIVAIYSGDANFIISTSPAFTQTVGYTATVVTSSSPWSNPGEPVTFTATVTPSSGSGETGTVQFQIDGGNVGSPIALTGNTALYTISTLATGTHSVVAIYSGDSNFVGSVSPVFTQSVYWGTSLMGDFVRPQNTYTQSGRDWAMDDSDDDSRHDLATANAMYPFSLEES